MAETRVLLRAEFDSASVRYGFVGGAILCLVLFPLLPIWRLGFGQWISSPG